MRHLVAIFIIILIALAALGFWAWLNNIPFIDDFLFNKGGINDEVLMDYDDMRQAPTMLLIWFSTASILSFVYFFWNQKRND